MLQRQDQVDSGWSDLQPSKTEPVSLIHLIELLSLVLLAGRRVIRTDSGF